MRILVAVTHLLGTGHLRRSLNLAQAFASQGHTVVLASGGFPVDHFNFDGITLIQLPPLRADGTRFTRLLQQNDADVDEKVLASRRATLSSTVSRLQPDIVITELFPFGRRVLKQEFLSLLHACRTLEVKPIVLSSVRDILSRPSTDKKANQTEALITENYDGVLVHSDRHTTLLDQSWPVTAALESRLFYTGYVTDAVRPEEHSSDPADVDPVGAGAQEIVVSAGGAAVGRPLFEAAVAAAQLSPKLSWRVLVGGADAQQEMARLRDLDVSGTVKIESLRSDFQQLLQNAYCSVSMCGYNTAVDILRSNTPAVVVPFDEGGEEEQVIRARSLASDPSISMLLAGELSPQGLLASIETVCSARPRKSDQLQFDGAMESVRIAVRLVDKKRQHANENV